MAVELNFQSYGTGEPVIILHGLFGSGRNWSSIARQLAENYTVVCVDLRNHGSSGHAPGMTYPEMAGDVIKLADQLEFEKFNLIGHSMGGKTAMVASLLHPEKISRISVIDIAPVTYTSNHDELISAMLALPVHEIENRTHADELLATDIPEPVLRQFLLQNLVKNGAHYNWRININAIKCSHANLRQFPAEVTSLKYAGPALFLSGSLSDYVKPEHEKEIAVYFPHHKRVVVDKANHWVHADQPGVVLKEINSFLDGN